MTLLGTLLGTDGVDDSKTATDGGVAAGDVATDTAAAAGERARCRNCGRYYGAAAETCPHCGSANKLLGGPAGGTHQRR